MADSNNLQNFVKVVAMGPIDFELTLCLSREEMQKFNIPEISTIESLASLKEILITSSGPKQGIADLIRLSSTNQTLSSLILINKAFHKKTFIEYLALSEFSFSEEEAFIKDLVKYVTEQNYVFIIENSIYPIEWRVKFTIKLAETKDTNQIKTFTFAGKGHDSKVNKNIDMNYDSEHDEGEESKQTKNKEEKTIDNDNLNNLPLFDKLNYDFEFCNYFYLDLVHFLNQDINSFVELLKTVAKDKSIYIMINYPDIIYNLSNFNIEAMTCISEIISLTDIFIFEKKEALAMFNLVHSLSSDTFNEEKKNLEQIFLKDVNKKRTHLPKIGIIFDEMKKVTVIEQQPKNNLVLFHSDFELKIIPEKISKILHEDYLKLLVVHHAELKATFLGGFLSRLIYKKSFNTCYTAGSESTKRILELLRFELDPPLDSNFYLIRIKRGTGVSKEKREEEMKRVKKEQHFVLDCVNIQNSKMQTYNPLYDSNLQSFFSSGSIQSHLKKLGFINRKGQILQDPDIKRLGMIKNKNLLKMYEDEQKKLVKIREDNLKMKLQINNIFNKSGKNLQNVDLNELENMTKVYNFYPVSGKKLPTIDAGFSFNQRNEIVLKSNDEKKTKGKFLEPLSKENYKKLLDNYEDKLKEKDAESLNN